VLDHNAGFAVASNKGAAGGGGEFIFLLNPDAEIVLGTTIDVAAAFDHDPSVKIVGSKMVDKNDRPVPSVRQFPTLSALVLYQFKLRPWARRFTPLRRYLMVGFPAGAPALVDQVMGASFIMRRSDWDRFCGLDERFFLWFEEVDLSRRIALAGGRSLYWPSIVVRHVGGASFAMLSRRKRQAIWNTSMLTYANRHLGRRATMVLSLTAPASLGISILLDVSFGVLRSLRRHRADADRRPSHG
jgi:N-acetylglucosaminyl-diphospho-decaprenol L-rhamnosyltransferase